MDNEKIKVLAVVGPTAAGKTALALALAKLLPKMEVVNADAVQVFRGMDVGTAKPTREQLAKVRHHLVDVLDPITERPSAGWFAHQARQAILDIRERGGIPVIVGGSGLYISAALDGIADIPPIPGEVREELRRELAEEGMPKLRAELATADPQTMARIAFRDTQRTLRALEVWRATKIPLSQWQMQTTMTPWQGVIAGLEPERDVLYERIDERLDAMFGGGLEEEVKHLLEQGADVEGAALGALGYRHMALYLMGATSREQALRQAKLDSRHYAKRQLTYFRSMGHIRWWSIHPDKVATIAPEVYTWFKSECA
jgi:tRNA dimethylallyltransferase